MKMQALSIVLARQMFVYASTMGDGEKHIRGISVYSVDKYT